MQHFHAVPSPQGRVQSTKSPWGLARPYRGSAPAGPGLPCALTLPLAKLLSLNAMCLDLPIPRPQAAPLCNHQGALHRMPRV